MKMNKMFAGLIAFVAGVALSAGSAFATNGYVGGDHANMKLVPFFETGENRATLIAIQNLSPQEASTVALNADVTDIQAVLDGGAANANAAGLIVGVADTESICGTAACTPGQTPDPTRRANAEAALERAMMATYTEHTFIGVNVHDAMGMMMGSATLCLAENQFGYVILQGPEMQDWQTEIPNRGMILSEMDGDIPASGYAMISAGARKFDSCTATPPDGLTRVDDDVDATNTIGDTTNRVASWAIIQDTGMGFFGTEVPTATISMAMTAADASTTPPTAAGDPAIACYSAPTDATSTTVLTFQNGNFDMARCGLIPERHNIDGTDATPLDSTTTTINNVATARYDVGDESMVYVWLAEGMDTDDTLPSMRRMLDVVVRCEEGGPAMMVSDIDGNMGPAQVAAPGMVTMIDPRMGAVGELTDMCEGDRGVLDITMPNGSHAGMVFTHIAQAGNSYRMNFPGYSMASPTEVCSATTPVGAPASACR